MNFYLKDLNLHFDHKLLDEAEALISSGDLQKIVEVKKDQWQLNFQYENAAAQCTIKDDKVRKYACNCVQYTLYKKCKHVATICMLIQKIKLSADNPINKADVRLLNSVPLGKILQNTQQVELVNFLIQFAKYSPELTLALKARFLFNFLEEISPEMDPILSLQVEKFVQSKRPAENRLFNLYKTIDAYFDQADAKLNEQETMMSFSILNLIGFNLKKLFKSGLQEDQLLLEKGVKLLDETFSLWKIFVAPQAKKQIIDLYLDMFETLEYVTNNKWHEKFAEKLMLTISRSDEYIDIKQVLIDKSLQKISFLENKAVWLNFIIYSENLRGNKSDFDEILIVVDKNIDLLRALFSRLISKLNYQEAIALVLFIQNKDVKYFKHYDLELNEVLLEMYIRTKSWKKTHDLAVKIFPLQPSVESLQYIKKQFPDKFAELLEDLNNIQYNNVADEISAEIVFSGISNDYQKPLEMIRNAQDLSLLMKYDSLFWKSNKEETVELYKQLSIIYLETHFGEPAQEYIRMMYVHLEKAGYRAEGKTIKKFLEQSFKKRNLPENLIEFPIV